MRKNVLNRFVFQILNLQKFKKGLSKLFFFQRSNQRPASNSSYGDRKPQRYARYSHHQILIQNQDFKEFGMDFDEI